MARIGALRDRCFFEKKHKVADDGGGGKDYRWVPALTVWGALAPTLGGEQVQAGRLQSTNAAVLTIRSSSEAREITAAYRVTIRDAVYNIRNLINPDRRDRFLDIELEAGVAT